MGLDVKQTRSTTTVSATVAVNGSPVVSAVVTGSVYDPTGKKLVDAADMPHQGNGVYSLTLDAGNTSLEGTYIADVKAVWAGQQVTGRFEFYLKT